jgi:trans-L-3-hydroxyproline dehydratase
MDLEKCCSWLPPKEWFRITTLDAHTCGEPLRIVIAGFPEICGQSILAQRAYAKEKLDHLRKVLMWEPRGHADMYGCLIVPPETPDADFGILFTHNEGYSSMCGHGIIAAVTALIDTGALPATAPSCVVKIDAPAGRIVATAELHEGKVAHVSFDNVPSFVVELDAKVHIPEIGSVVYDLAFGGAFYAYVRGDQFNPPLRCLESEYSRMIDLGCRIKREIVQSRPISHPSHGDLGFLYGTIFTAPAQDSANHSRNCCVFAEGEVDRSPTGTGVAGRAAIHHARGELRSGERIRIESFLGTCMDVEVVRETTFGPYEAVVPRVSGTAFLTGRNEFWVNPADPLKYGFLVR